MEGLPSHPFTAGVARLAVAIVGLLVSPHALPAQEQDEDRPRPCSAEAYRGFDFWLGKWEVRNPAGEIAGANTIRAVLDGCALQEDWRGTRGSVGRSISVYEARTGTWHQTWVDNSGLSLRLDGGPVEGSMILAGDLQGSDGQVRLHRITWTPREDGTVRQLWQRSGDAGETWSTVFDGMYAPAAQE